MTVLSPKMHSFAAEAVDRPLVWDEDSETAIQSPHGGTKIAWGGPTVAPKHGVNRQLRSHVDQR